MENMPEPKDATQAVVYMEQAICNILVPTFDEKKNPKSPLSDAWEARWRVVYDLKNMNMYFDQDESGKRVYMKIRNIDFSGKVIRYIDPMDLRSEYNM
jgi:penicillin V acylase-like amidase (Ntn superfamily)